MSWRELPWCRLAFDLGLYPAPRGGRQFSLGCGLGGAVIGLIFALLLLLNAVQVEGWAAPPRGGGWGTGFLLIASAVNFFWRAALEEILARGFLFQKILRRGSLPLALVGSSAAFAALHLANPHWTPLAMFNLALAGLFFALLFLKTGTLWLAIGAHASFNFFEGTIFSLPVSGYDWFHLLRVESTGPVGLTGGAFGPEGGLVCTGVLVLACALTAFLGSRQPLPVERDCRWE